MTSYLLLRNNKESGPYSLDQLVDLGLKAYDLVWVTGRSAAWRYPGEVEELKAYAPVVEEQPFDRFFKKPSEQQASGPTPVQKEEIPVVKQKQTTYTPAKSVFVTLPGNVKVKTEPVKQEPKEDPYQKYQPGYQQQQEQPVVAKTITITENPVAAEIKYSQPLDEIKEMYVKTLYERKQRIANKALLLQWGKKAAVVLAIVGVGVAIGFAMKSGSSKEPVLSQTAVPTQPAVINETTTDPVQENNQESIENNPAITGNQSVEQPQQFFKEESLNETPATEEKRTAAPAERVIEEKSAAPPLSEKKETSYPPVEEPSPGVELNARTGERTRKVRETSDQSATTISEEKETVKPKAVMKSGGSLSKLVTVSSNEYTKVAFGGIRNLQLTVTNESKYILDNVTVELQYLKPSEEPLKTETVQFRSVSPGGSLTIRVPDTNRGIKVNYRITHILSTQSAKELADL
jgi:hypothetical protein